MEDGGATLIAASVLAFANPRPARATTIGFAPTSSTHGVGDIFGVDIVVSGLDSASQIVSAFDLTVRFDESLLAATNVTFGPYLGDPDAFEAFSFFSTSMGAQAMEVSLLPDTDLLSLQLDTIRLFTIQFQALAPGTSFLTFEQGTNDVKGVAVGQPPNQEPSILLIDPSDGSVDVVPEPAVTLLIALGSVGIAFRRRFPNRSA